MDAIGSVSNNSWLQMLSRTTETSRTVGVGAASPTTSTGGATGASGAAPPPPPPPPPSDGGSASGISPSDLRQLIDEAIEEAIAGLDESATDEEKLAAVKDAVDTTLRENGIDPESLPPPPPPGGPGGGGPGGMRGASGSEGASASTSANRLLESLLKGDSDQDGDGGDSTASAASDTTAASAAAQLLTKWMASVTVGSSVDERA